MAIKLLIADDHKIFRQGLRELFEKEAEIEVIGDAGSGDEVMTLLKLHPDAVILMDIDMGATNGITLTTEVTQAFPKTRVLALSMHGEKNYVLKMLEAGASGYMLKNAGKEEMLNAIHTVSSGNTYFSQEVSAQLLLHLNNPKATQRKKHPGTQLTAREIEVLRLIANEYSNPEIAEKLYISVRTVDTHRRNLLDKLGVKNTAGLVRFAIQNELVD